MALSKDQEKFYQNVREQTKKEYEETGDQIQQELENVKKRLAELQEARAGAKETHEAACRRLGVESDIPEEEEA